MREDLRSLLHTTAVHLVVSALFPCILSIRIKQKNSISTTNERFSKKKVFKTTQMSRENERLKERGKALQSEVVPEKVPRRYTLLTQTQESLRLKRLSFEDVRLK